MSDNPSTEWVALGEASKLLGVDPDTLRRWADEGRVPVFLTPGGHRRFDREVIEEMASAPKRGTIEQIAQSARSFIAACARALRPRRSREPWGEPIPGTHRQSFRARGRAVAELLVAYVGAPQGAARLRLLERASTLGHDYGEEAAAVGISLTEAVDAFTFFRSPVIDALSQEVRRLGLSGPEAALAFADVNAALDRLLLAVIEGHQKASP